MDCIRGSAWVFSITCTLFIQRLEHRKTASGGVSLLELGGALLLARATFCKYLTKKTNDLGDIGCFFSPFQTCLVISNGTLWILL